MLLGSLEITFVGHACFLIESGAARLLTDPYSTAIGYAATSESVNVVTLSHENPKYHSCLDDVQTQEVIRGLEHTGQTVQSGPFEISFIEVFENLRDGQTDGDGSNAMTLIEAANLRILHMGDCGHLPTPAQTKACGRVDVLLALAGAGPTIALPDLLKFIEIIEPKIVIPMHFGVPNLTMQIAPVEELEALWPGEIQRGDSSCHVFAPQLPDAPVLRVLKPLRLRV